MTEKYTYNFDADDPVEDYVPLPFEDGEENDA